MVVFVSLPPKSSSIVRMSVPRHGKSPLSKHWTLCVPAREDRVGEHIDGEMLGERLEPLEEPIAAVGIVGAGVGIEPAD